MDIRKIKKGPYRGKYFVPDKRDDNDPIVRGTVYHSQTKVRIGVVIPAAHMTSEYGPLWLRGQLNFLDLCNPIRRAS